MNALDRPPLGIRLTLVLLVAVLWMGAASGTFARMSVPQPAWSEPPVTFTPTGLFGCDGEGPGSPRAGSAANGCRLLAVPPPGTQPATWTLDPAWQFYPDATELHVLVEVHGACPCFLRYVDVVAQHVDESQLFVAVTLAVGTPNAFANPDEFAGADTICPDVVGLSGNPFPWVLKLPEPVGKRILLDAGTGPGTVVAPDR